MAQVREHALLPLLDAAGAPPVADRADRWRQRRAGEKPMHRLDSAAYLDALGDDERVGVCLDTCHMHAAGHDLSSAARHRAQRSRKPIADKRYRPRPRSRCSTSMTAATRPARKRRSARQSIGAGTIEARRRSARCSALAGGARRAAGGRDAADADHAGDVASAQGPSRRRHPRETPCRKPGSSWMIGAGELGFAHGHRHGTGAQPSTDIDAVVTAHIERAWRRRHSSAAA